MLSFHLAVQRPTRRSATPDSPEVFFREVGKCSLPSMREKDLSDRLGDVLKDIYVPDTIARTLVDSLQADKNRAEATPATEDRRGRAAPSCPADAHGPDV